MSNPHEQFGTLDPRLAERILSSIHEKELIEMCCDVVNIPSPTGDELKMAEYMQNALGETGLEVTWHEVEEGRANVIGRWEGVRDGRNLMFNGHLDTSNTGEEDFLSGIGYKPHAVIQNEMIYGLGIYNMKGALVCYTQAVRALMRAGVKLNGDVLIGAVAGEIEKTQWRDFKGREFRGYGAGTHYMVNHGVLPDMCILGEPTDMKLVLEHFGSLWVRIAVKGIYVHTAFAEGRAEQTSVYRLREIWDPIADWIKGWELRTSYGGHCGIANIGCVSAGFPWRASRTPEKAEMFIDLRVPPTMTMQQARRDVKAMFTELRKRYPNYGLEFETYVSVPGARINEEHPMIKAIEANHARILGEPVQRDTVLWCSDASVMSRFGIESVNYGPSSGSRDAEGEKVAIKTLLDVTRVYALTAAELCGVAAS